MKKQSLKKAKLMKVLSLNGLHAAPAQNWRAVTLVPLCRSLIREDLRLSHHLSHETFEGEYEEYFYRPHGMVMSWSERGEATTTWETQVGVMSGGQAAQVHGRSRQVSRMSDVLSPTVTERVQFLPMQLAIESYLSLFHARPEVASRVFSEEVLRYGLRPQSVTGVRGGQVRFLDEAMRIFEIHPNQCGMVLMLNGRLASVFVVPHPEDYRLLHGSVLEDIYGEVFRNLYGQPYEDRDVMSIEADGVSSLAELRKVYEKARYAWAKQQLDWSSELLDQDVESKAVYQAGPFTLQRFMTSLDDGLYGHIGEAVVRRDGSLEYLKTFRLNARQVRRARLVRSLVRHGWSLQSAARDMGMRSVRQFKQALGREGLDYLFRG